MRTLNFKVPFCLSHALVLFLFLFFSSKKIVFLFLLLTVVKHKIYVFLMSNTMILVAKVINHKMTNIRTKCMQDYLILKHRGYDLYLK